MSTTRQNWFARHKILTGIGAFFLFIIVIAAISGPSEDSGSPSSPNTPKAEEYVEVTATDLYNEYQENRLVADDKYDGKILRVSGSISNIGKDILDNPYITLGTGELIGEIQCMLTGDSVERAKTLQDGQSVVVQGKNSGIVANVVLRNCEIID